jgi:hypothetical protein
MGFPSVVADQGDHCEDTVNNHDGYHIVCTPALLKHYKTYQSSSCAFLQPA